MHRRGVLFNGTANGDLRQRQPTRAYPAAEQAGNHPSGNTIAAMWIPQAGRLLVSDSTTCARLFSDYLNEGKKADLWTI
jgi:hypothetical protein